jgi:hypothetical protein
VNGVAVLILVLLGGCPPTTRDGTTGPIKDPVADPDPSDPGSIKKGTWCCRSCTSANGILTCAGCTSAPAATTVCTKAGETVLADCPGRTTYDGTNVVCY